MCYITFVRRLIRNKTANIGDKKHKKSNCVHSSARKYICIDESEQRMATSTMTATNHFASNISANSSQDTNELSSRLTQLHLRERERERPQKIYSDASESNIPRRQPTIVCEDIADDIDIEGDDQMSSTEMTEQCSDVTGKSMPRSASTASLTGLLALQYVNTDRY